MNTSKLIKLTLFSFLVTFRLLGQHNSWLPPFNLNHDHDIATEMEVRTMSCLRASLDYHNKYNRFVFYQNNYVNRPVVTVSVNINIWQKDDGSENWENTPESIARLNQIMAWVNNYYENNCAPSDPIAGVVNLPSTKIKIRLNAIKFYQNSVCWGKGSGGGNDAIFLNNAAEAVDPDAANRLNIHITGGSFVGAAGFATFPSETFLAKKHYVVTFNNEHNPVGDWAFATHLVHELGHNFDLHHTYNDAICDQTNVDYLDDVFGTGPGVSCPHNAGFSCDPFIAGNTCTNNVMGGTQHGCYFSPKQIASIHRALALKSIRRYVDVESYPTENYIDVTANEIWDFNIKFYNSIRVKSGATLTIKCIVVMCKGLNIVVEPGGHLILDGGTITTDSKDYWGGIQVWGNTNLTQTTANQGKITTKNDAKIEFARNGIKVWKDGDWSKAGGILNCNDTYFENNWRSIEYITYHRYNASGNEIPNLGLINNCQFLWNNNYVGTSIAAAITMLEVNGVRIIGSDFIDSRTGITNLSNRTNGIFSIDAGYKVIGKNIGGIGAPVHHDYSETNYDVCLFKNLKKGIEATTSTLNPTILVDHCKFEDLFTGVAVKAMDNAVITRNKFEFTTTHPTDIYVMNGLVLDASTGFKVEGNIFTNQVTNSGTTGVIVYNSGIEQNSIYRNTFTNLFAGTYSNGNNTNDLGGANQASGLQFLCNKYNTTQQYDQYVFTFPNANGNGQGIRLRQGTSIKPAGNEFSILPVADPRKHIKSDDFDNIIYHYSAGANELPTNIDGRSWWSIDNFCKIVSFFI